MRWSRLFECANVGAAALAIAGHVQAPSRVAAAPWAMTDPRAALASPGFRPGADRPPKRRPADVGRWEISDSGEIELRGDADDQCYIDGWASLGRNNKTARFVFLLDSGSASAVAFGTQHYAELGGDVASLVYDVQTLTSNGFGRAATIHLHDLRIAGVVLHNVSGLVSEGGEDTPLLGAPVLRLLQYQLARDGCVLTVPSDLAAKLPG